MANTTNEAVQQPVSAEASTPAEKQQAVMAAVMQNGTENSGDRACHSVQPNSTGTKQVRYSFQKKPFVIGVAGGTASGKSTVCSKIMEKLGPIDPTSVYLSHEKRVICLSQDSFYRKLTEEERALVAKGNFNFDHPSAFDVNLLVSTLREVQNGRMVKVPVYNYMENEIGDTEQVIYPADVVLVEGLLLFYFPEVREMFHMKIFVDTDPDTRLSRRVMRDVTERNRPLDVVLSQYTKFVKPSFEEFCLPTKKYADIIVPRGPDNEVAVDLIVTHVQSIFDPSIRHQSIRFDSIKYYDDAKRTGAKSKDARPKKSLLIKKANRINGFERDDQSPLTVASIMNGKCITPMVNGHYQTGNSVAAQRSEPIEIINGHHSPLLRNGFISSSAPSHLNGFANGFSATSGINDAICSEDENELEVEMTIVNGGSSPKSSQSPRKVPPPTLHSPSKVAKAVVSGNNSQQPAAPILLVASR